MPETVRSSVFWGVRICVLISRLPWNVCTDCGLISVITILPAVFEMSWVSMSL